MKIQPTGNARPLAPKAAPVTRREQAREQVRAAQTVAQLRAAMLAVLDSAD